MRRKSELEAQLVRARGTDFSAAKDDAVCMGTRVRVTDLEANHPETFTILGAWDSDPEKGVVSYLTPLAQALVGKKLGEEVEFDMDGTKKRYRIDAIEVCAPQPPPLAAEPELAPTSAPTPANASVHAGV
jgi:transcription elongation GreA/GreB family factor